MNHLLADKRKKYHVRAVSRDTSSAKAEALVKQGVEVVQGDLGDKNSLVKVWLVLPFARSGHLYGRRLDEHPLACIRYCTALS